MKKIAGLLLGGLLISGCLSSDIKEVKTVEKTVSKPNVVIIYADDLGWSDLAVNNSDPHLFRYTPNIDRFFTQGVRIDNYVTHCVCSPSRAGLLTGKHYAKVMAGPEVGGELPFDDNTTTFAADFQKSGYKTGCFGKWHNSNPAMPTGGTGKLVADKSEIIPDNEIYEYTADTYFGIGVNGYGFDRFVGYYGGGSDLFNRIARNQCYWWHDTRHSNEPGYTTDLITKYATEFIDQNKDVPFCCYVPEEAVHGPVQLKRSDLKEFCGMLETKLGITGQWDYVKGITSKKTGRRIEDVAEIKCNGGEEFSVPDLDAGDRHYNNLMLGCYLYSLDKSVGAIVEKVKEAGQFKNTIFVFASDNGGTPKSCNLPFQGGKHSIWEGGVHVPAAIWWPGTFDAETAPYTPANNRYVGYMGYLDLYPTLMAMTGSPCTGKNLDGKNCWDQLRKNVECRPDFEDPYYEIWREQGSIRTAKWKLIYSESWNRIELYDLDNDVAEANNVADANPAIRDTLIMMYKDWLKTNNFAVPSVPIDQQNISHPDPAPEGEVLEVKAWQDQDRNTGLYVRFAIGDWVGGKTGGYTEPGDRIEYDIYVCDDSEKTAGIFYTPGRGWDPMFKPNSGLDQDGKHVYNMENPKGEWRRHTVGIGVNCPLVTVINYIVMRDGGPGYYHFYIDNVVVRKNDGTIRTVLWKSEKDTTPLIYCYDRKHYNGLKEALASPKFPFKDVQIKAVDLPAGAGL